MRYVPFLEPGEIMELPDDARDDIDEILVYPNIKAVKCYHLAEKKLHSNNLKR